MASPDRLTFCSGLDTHIRSGSLTAFAEHGLCCLSQAPSYRCTKGRDVHQTNLNNDGASFVFWSTVRPRHVTRRAGARSPQSADACGGNRLVRSVPADWPARCPTPTPVPNREPMPLGRRAEHAWIRRLGAGRTTRACVPLPAVQPGSPRGRGAGWPAYARGGYRGVTRSRSPFITGRGSRSLYPA